MLPKKELLPTAELQAPCVSACIGVYCVGHLEMAFQPKEKAVQCFLLYMGNLHYKQFVWFYEV